MSLQEALTDVADWLVCHTNEVVIIALSAFEDVTPVQHNNLINFLIQLFCKKLCPKSVSSCILFISKVRHVVTCLLTLLCAVS